MWQIIAAHDGGDVKVTTYSSPTGYETRVMDLAKDGGLSRTVGIYQWDRLKALEGHQSAIEVYCKKQDFSMRISLKSLMVVLYNNMVMDGHLIAAGNREETNTLIFEKNSGRYRGSCIYDLDKGEIIDATFSWRNILIETQSEMIDKLISKQDD